MSDYDEKGIFRYWGNIEGNVSVNYDVDQYKLLTIENKESVILASSSYATIEPDALLAVLT